LGLRSRKRRIGHPTEGAEWVRAMAAATPEDQILPVSDLMVPALNSIEGQGLLTVRGGTSSPGNLESVLKELSATPNRFQSHATAGLRFAARKPALKQALAKASLARARTRIREAAARAIAMAELEDQQRTHRSEGSDTGTTESGSGNSEESAGSCSAAGFQVTDPATFLRLSTDSPKRADCPDLDLDLSVDSEEINDVVTSASSRFERSITCDCDTLHSKDLGTESESAGAMMMRRPTMQREGGVSTWNGPLWQQAEHQSGHDVGDSRADPIAEELETDFEDIGLSHDSQDKKQALRRTIDNADVRHQKPGLKEWPADVRDAIDASDIVEVAKRSLPPTQPADEYCRVLRMVGAGHSIPHPEKGGGNDGADSFYMDSPSNSLGVADGVGEWEWRFKCSARAFADELMEGCRQSAQNVDASATRNLGAAALEMLKNGYNSTRSFGAATALVAKLGSETRNMGVACLGDACLLQLRMETVGREASLRCLSRTREQQHSFNCPFQLARLPIPSDYPKLLQEGKEALVRAVERSKSAKQDAPEDAECYVFNVQRGDLIVMGTDGLFDNLYDQEICQIADSAVTPLEVHGLGGEQPPGGKQHRYEEELAARLASALAKAAYHRSTGRSGRTPFCDHARQVGRYHTGGKMDDITCVCAWIV